MNKKIRILLIFLGMVSLSGLGLAVWIYFAAQAEVGKYVQGYSSLKEKNISLQKEINTIQKKFDSVAKDIEHWQEKSEATSQALNRLGKEHMLLQHQYTALLKAKEDLLEENKGLAEQLEKKKDIPVPEAEALGLSATGTTDEFLASLLEEKATLQVQVESLREQIEALEGQVHPVQQKSFQLTKEKAAIEQKFKDSEKISTVLSNELLQEKKKRMAVEEELAKTEARIGDIVAEKDRLADELDRMKQALEQRLMELDRTKEVLEGAVKSANKAVRRQEPASIELSPIVVKAEEVKKDLSGEEEESSATLLSKLDKAEITEKEGPFELSGRVIKINEKYKFLVIDIGRDDGVEKGMSFDVYRKDKKVGKVQVIETRRNIAACDIKEKGISKFKLSDIVRR